MTELPPEKMAELEKRAGEKLLREIREALIAESDAAYRSSLNRLWAANGAGAGVIASAKGISAADYFGPLAIFIIGLLFLAAGEVVELVRKWRRLREIENADTVFDLRAGYALKPTERVGLSFRNAQTISGFLSAATFVIATLWSLAKLS